MKRFLEWMGLKEKLHNKEHKPPLFKEGEVWWCYWGENIGIEINGKNNQFTRPVFILKKYDKYSFLGLPLSTKIKTGTWYVNIQFTGLDQTISLSQGRVFDYKRLKEKVGEMNLEEVEKIRAGYLDLHSHKKIDPSQSLAKVVGNPKYTPIIDKP